MSKETRIKLSKRIKALRKQHKYTQEKLSEISGISYENIQKIESKNPHNPQLDTLEKIARAFKISLSELLKF